MERDTKTPDKEVVGTPPLVSLAPFNLLISDLAKYARKYLYCGIRVPTDLSPLTRQDLGNMLSKIMHSLK